MGVRISSDSFSVPLTPPTPDPLPFCTAVKGSLLSLHL